MTLYIDGRQDATVSSCCEYKHRRGTLIGSKTSHFQFVKVTGADMCYKCRVEAELSAKAEKEKEAREQRNNERDNSKVMASDDKADKDADEDQGLSDLE